MAELHGWNVAAGSNNSASPNGFPAGMLPSGVHPSAREVMAVLARYDKDNDGSLTTGGTTTAYTVTLNSQHSAWFTGLRFRVKFNATCGATPTINPTGSTALGAKSLYFPDGTQVTTGYLVSGGMYDCVYDGTNVQVVSVSSVPTGVIVTTRGDLLTRGASALSRLAIGTANTVLKTDGTDPSWGKVAGTMIRMGSDAQGDVYYFNGTDVARLGAGTSGQFLKTNGAGANPAWASAANGLVALQRVNSSSAATYDFTTTIDGTYRTYKLIGWLQPATDDVELWLRVSVDGGSNYRATAADYRRAGQSNNDGGTNLASTSASMTELKLTTTDAGQSIGNAATEGVQFEITIQQPSSGTRDKLITAILSWYNPSTVACGGQVHGAFVGVTTAVNALRLMFESGNIAVGDVTLYGVANS